MKDLIEKINTLSGEDLYKVKRAIKSREEYLDATTRKPIEYGELYTLSDFIEEVASGYLVPSDGCGYYGTLTEVSDLQYTWWDLGVDRIAKDYGFTHIIWYNK